MDVKEVLYEEVTVSTTPADIFHISISQTEFFEMMNYVMHSLHRGETVLRIFNAIM